MSVADDIWELVWQNFIVYVGDTMASLQKSLSDVATTMSLAGYRSPVADNTIRFMLNVANGGLTGNNFEGRSVYCTCP